MSTEKTSTLETKNQIQKNKTILDTLKHGSIGLILVIAIILYFWSAPKEATVTPKVQPMQFTLFPYHIASASCDFNTLPTAYVYRDGLNVDNDVYVNKDKITLVLHEPGLYTIVCANTEITYVGSIYVAGETPEPEPAPEPAPEPEPVPEVIDDQLLQDLNGNVPSLDQLKSLADNFDTISNNTEKGVYVSQSEMLCALVNLNQSTIQWLSTDTSEADTDAKWYAILGAGGFIDKYFMREGLTEESELDTFIAPLRVVAATMRRAQ